MQFHRQDSLHQVITRFIQSLSCATCTDKISGSEKYFRGGYTTQVHGSLDGGLVDAIQLEAPREVRIDGGESVRKEFAEALARAIANFYATHYSELRSDEKVDSKSQRNRSQHAILPCILIYKMSTKLYSHGIF